MSLRLISILFLALVSVSSTSLVIRHLAVVPALTMAFWRLFFAGGMLWGYSLFSIREKLSMENRKRTVLAGVLLGCHFACFFIGVKNTSIANSTLLATLGPVFTAIIVYGQGNPIQKHVFLGLFFALAGAGIINFSSGDSGINSLFGNGISLLSALFLALTWIVAKKIREDTGVVIYGRSLFLVAAGTILIFSFLAGDSIFDFQLQHLLWFLFLGFVPSILGHNLFNYALKYIPPTSVASVPLGEPVLASIFGIIIFGENVPVGALVGGPFVFFGLYLILKTKNITLI